jgi:hypothetical protein
VLVRISTATSDEPIATLSDRVVSREPGTPAGSDPRLPATAELERYVSRHELAGLMGVSIATIDRMVTEGMPSVTWGRRTRRFKPSAAMAWARTRRAA